MSTSQYSGAGTGVLLYFKVSVNATQQFSKHLEKFRFLFIIIRILEQYLCYSGK